MLLTHYKEPVHTSHLFLSLLLPLLVRRHLMQTANSHSVALKPSCAENKSKETSSISLYCHLPPESFTYKASDPIVLNTTLNLKGSPGTFLHKILLKWVITVYTNTNSYNLNHLLLKLQQITAFHRCEKLQLRKFLLSNCIEWPWFLQSTDKVLSLSLWIKCRIYIKRLA